MKKSLNLLNLKFFSNQEAIQRKKYKKLDNN